MLFRCGQLMLASLFSLPHQVVWVLSDWKGMWCLNSSTILHTNYTHPTWDVRLNKLVNISCPHLNSTSYYTAINKASCRSVWVWPCKTKCDNYGCIKLPHSGNVWWGRFSKSPVIHQTTIQINVTVNKLLADLFIFQTIFHQNLYPSTFARLY